MGRFGRREPRVRRVTIIGMKTLLFACIACAAPIMTFAQESTAPSTAAPVSISENVKNIDWLLGSWVFDEQFTLQKIGDSAKDVSATDSPGLSSQLVEKMRGATVTVTRTDLTMARGDGNIRSEKYTVEPSSNEGVISLKQSNGEVITFHRDGDRIWTSSNGSSGDLFFFKKAQ